MVRFRHILCDILAFPLRSSDLKVHVVQKRSSPAEGKSNDNIAVFCVMGKHLYYCQKKNRPPHMERPIFYIRKYLHPD